MLTLFIKANDIAVYTRPAQLQNACAAGVFFEMI